MTLLAPTLQAFFAERLITQRNASPHTIASYRDTFRLLLAFASKQVGKQPYELDIDDLNAPVIGAFLNHLEIDRGNSARTRNNRLAAIHSLYRYAALKHPEHPPDDRPGDGDPGQALRAKQRQLSQSSPRSGRCSPRRTAAAGTAVATTRSCWSRSRPGCGPPSWSACASAT